MFSKADMKEIESGIEKNFIMYEMNAKECIGCGAFITKNENTTTNRLTCIPCKYMKKPQYEICWICLKPWIGQGSTNCGNPDC